MAKIVITGAAGFIGSHLTRFYLDQGDEVVGIDDLTTGRMQNLAGVEHHPRLTFFAENLCSWPKLSQAMLGADRVFHLAAVLGMFNVLSHPIRTLQVNVEATRRVLDAAALMEKKPVVLVASSSEVYGNQASLMREDDKLLLESTAKPHASYCLSKMCDENLAMSYFNEYRLQVIVARIFNTIGPAQSGQYGMVVPRFIEQAKKGEPIMVYGDGRQTRCFCHVGRLCRMLDALSNNRKSDGEIINVGDDHPIQIEQLALLIKKLTASDSPIQHQDYGSAYGQGYIAIRERRPDLSKLHSLIPPMERMGIEQALIDIIG